MQDTDDAGAELRRLGDAIATIVTEEFERTRRVVLLSNLGLALKNSGIDYKEVLPGRKLAEFIRSELSDRVTLVPVPGKDKVIAIHPAGIDLSAEIDPFGPSSVDAPGRGMMAPKDDKRPLFHSQVWFAFSHFLAEGQTRLLELQPEPTYHDLSAAMAEPGTGYTIDRKLIIPVGSMAKSDRDTCIYENIVKWAESAHIPIDALLAKKTERAERRNLLDEVLRTLSHSELSRVVLPLDVIRTLRERRL